MNTINESPAPAGKLISQTIAMPRETNANGDIFGGWLLSQMDLAGAILAGRIAKGRVTEGEFVFVAIDDSGKTRQLPSS